MRVMTGEGPGTANAVRPLGDYLVGLLEANGVEVVFGIPGVHTLELYRGLSGRRIRHVLTRHEQGAAFAADGYARMSGRPGVCFLISGPGVGNAMTAIGQAYSDSVPLLVVSAVAASDTLGKGSGVLHEVTDQRAMTAPVTAFSATAFTAGDVEDHLRRAFALFASGRKRPVHIAVPIDILAGTTDRVAGPFAAPSGPPLAPKAAIEAAAGQLRDAERPLLILGGGAAEAGRAALRIAEATGAYVATTVAAKGAVPDGHPAHLGATLQWPAIQALANEADVVLAAGTELAETDLYIPTLALAGRLIRIDIDPGRLADRYRAGLPILGDAADALARIAAALGKGRRPGQPWRGAAAGLREAASRHSLATERGRRQAATLAAIRRALPDDGALYTDMTQIAYSGNALFPAPAPRSWFHPSGYGTLGYALPAAIGGKIAAPGRPVAALLGDYGFQFTLPELATAAQEGLSLPVLVWNNDRLAQISDDMVASGIPEIGVAQTNPDFLLLAQAYGLHGVRPSGPDALEAALRGALARPAPTVIDIREDRMPA
jgi:5-guanidino-2-oxopentanoate decarboxylase